MSETYRHRKTGALALRTSQSFTVGQPVEVTLALLSNPDEPHPFPNVRRWEELIRCCPFQSPIDNVCSIHGRPSYLPKVDVEPMTITGSTLQDEWERQ